MADKLLRSHSLEKSKGADGITTSGSFSFWEDSPVSPLNIGDDFQPVPGGPTLKVGKVSISDSVVGERFGRPFRQWQITVEGDNSVQFDDTGDSNVKYTFLIEKGEDGLTKRTGTMEVTNTGASPSISVQVGGSFNVPGVGAVTCTKVSGGDSYTDSGSHKWTITYEGAKVEAGGGDDDNNPTLPESEEEITYEINGTTTRSVSGEFIVLRRSTTPITKKSLTVYNNSATRLATPGSTYADTGAVAISEVIAKEIQKSNGVEIGSYYRHELTLEA